MQNNQEQISNSIPVEQVNQPAIPGKDIAIISYLTIIGLIAAFIMNSEKKAPFASYHIRQVLGLALTGISLGFIGIIPILGWLVAIFGSILLFIMWVTGLINAINGREKPLPVLGKKYEEWFKGIGN